MLLYHGTKPENIPGLLAEGVYPSISSAAGAIGCGHPVVYGFVSLDDAVAFCRENGYYPQVVVEFEADCQICLPDPEMAIDGWIWGEAYMVLTDTPIPARLAYITPGWEVADIALLSYCLELVTPAGGRRAKGKEEKTQKTISVNGRRYYPSQVDQLMTPETQCRHPGAYRIMLGGVEWIAEYRDPSDGYYTPVCSRSRAGAIRLESIAPYYRGGEHKIVWLQFRPD